MIQRRTGMMIGLAVALAFLGAAAVAQTPPPPPAPAPPTLIPTRPPISVPSAPKLDSGPRADSCCTPYGRFGPVGNPDGRPGAPCQWSLPAGVTQGSTCP